MSRPRAVVAIAALGLVLGLTGCNSDSSGGSDPTTSASSDSSGTDPSETTSDSASPSVAPATGPVLEMPSASINAPKGYQATKDIVDFSTDATSPDYTSSITLTALEYAGPTLPLDLLVKAVKKNYKGYKRLPDQELDGVTFYHLSGLRDEYTTEDVFSVRDSGYETTIRFTLDRQMSPAEREQLIAESLASFSFS